jgi:hypothetical protein
MYDETSGEVPRPIEADIYYTFDVLSIFHFSRKSDDTSLTFGGSGIAGRRGGRRRTVHTTT